MQLFNLWPCGAIFLNTYRIVTVIFWEILPHATFGDPIQRKKGIVGFSPNYPFFLGIWSERLDSNQRLPAPKKSTLFIIITDTYTLFIRSYKFVWLAPISPHTLWRFWRKVWCFWWTLWRIWYTLWRFWRSFHGTSAASFLALKTAIEFSKKSPEHNRPGPSIDQRLLCRRLRRWWLPKRRQIRQ